MGIDMDLISGKKGRTNFTCSICTDLIEDPVLIRYCQHRYCKTCIGGVVRHGRPECPECRHPFDPDVDIVVARFMVLMMADILLECPENGCDQIIRYDFGFLYYFTTVEILRKKYYSIEPKIRQF